MNILFVVGNMYYQRKMSRGRFHAADAIARHSDVENFRVVGQGFPGYSVHRPLEAIGFEPDVLLCYKPEDHPWVKKHPAIRVVTYNEAWPHIPGKAMAEVRSNNIDTVIHHHANDANCFRWHDSVHHIPHCAEPSVFWPEQRNQIEFRKRRNDTIFTGVDSPEIYPLRARLKRLVASKAVPGTVRPHPGYRLQNDAECNAQARSYALALRSSKISLCCTSKYRYALAKLVESWMAGCVVASDLPDDPVYCDAFAEFQIVLETGMTDDEMTEVIRGHLSKPDDLAERAHAGQSAALERFTMDHYADSFISTVKSCQSYQKNMDAKSV